MLFRLLILTALFSCALATPAYARWSAPVDVSGRSGSGIGTVDSAANERGDRVAVWDRRGVVWVAVARAGRRFGKPRAVPARRARYEFVDPRVAIGPAGDVIVLWHDWDNSRGPDPDVEIRDEGCCVSSKAIVMTARGPFGKPVTLVRRGLSANHERLAIRSATDFSVTYAPWREFVGPLGVEARFAAGRGRFGAPEQVAGADLLPLHASHAAARPRILLRGRRELLEVERTGANQYSAQTLVAGDIPDTTMDHGTVEENGRGEQVAAWDAFSSLVVGVRSPGQPMRVQTLPATKGENISTLDIARDGTALVGWRQLRSPGTVGVTFRPPGRDFGSHRLVFRGTSRYEHVASPVAALRPDGRALVVFGLSTSRTDWLASAAIGPTGRRRSAGRVPGAVQPDRFELHLDRRGRATATFIGGRRQVWASFER
jgi:hypothetical protein